MPILALSLLAAASLPTCQVDRLRLSLDGRDGEFNGMSHSGTELSIRNVGPDCMMAALPTIQLRDARNRLLAVVRQVPRGMHPGPVMVPVRLAAGHRAATELRWISGPVFPHNRKIRAARITVKFGTRALSAPMTAVIYTEVGKPATFEQTPLHAVEGMAAG